MKKLFLCLAACLMSAVMVQAQNKAIELSITTAAVGATNTFPQYFVADWQNLEGVKVEWPAASTNTLTLYCVAENGTTTWVISDAMTYANATALPVTETYNPTREFSFSTTTTSTEIVGAGAATNSTNTTVNVVANSVTKPYQVRGTPRYVLTRTGTASNTIKAVLFLKK